MRTFAEAVDRRIQRVELPEQTGSLNEQTED
jgi:hypothetical protein